jgi:DNA repair protein RadC
MKVRLSAADKIKILNSTAIYEIMRKVLMRQDKIRRKKEYFWLVGLEKDQTISFIELVAIGSANWVNIQPREIFRIAVLKDTPSVILVHNHPSGKVEPSQEDKDFTKDLKKSGKLLGISVVDHLIITPDNYSSFIDLKLIK